MDHSTNSNALSNRRESERVQNGGTILPDSVLPS